MRTKKANPASGRFHDDSKARATKARTDSARHHEARNRTANTPRRNDLAPALELIERPIESLTVPKRKLRKLDGAHIAEVASSIGALGFCQPILVNADGLILDGVTRHAAARQLGMETVSCIVLHHLTAATERTARIALNRLAERGTWDIEELRIELQELTLLDAPIEVMGFEEAELDILLIDDEAEEAEGPFAPDRDAPSIAAQGDAWMLGCHRVLCADATVPLTYTTMLGQEKARLLFSDPPYNVKMKGHASGLGVKTHREFVQASGEMSAESFSHFLNTFLRLSIGHLVDGGLLAVFMDWRSISSLLEAGSAVKLELLNFVVWSKTNGGMGSLYRSAHELLPIFKLGHAPHVNNIELGRHGRWRSNVWTYAGGSSLGSDAREHLADHPTPKPVPLIEDALLDVTHRGDIVLDPFLGSGSTLIAAERTGRRCYGSELDPLYVDLILRRWLAETGLQPILVETGETFAEVELRRIDEGSSALLAAPPPSSAEGH